MAVLFFVKRGERILGPTRLADLFQHAASGRLRANDLVGESPKGPWLPARQLDELEDAWASSRDATEAAAAEDDSERNRMYREHEETEAALGEPPSEKTAASGSRNTVLLWSLLGGFLVLLLGLIGGGVAMLWSGGVLASKPSSPQPVALSESDSDFKRALRLDAAARVLDRANAWVADAEAGDDGDWTGRRDELASIATEYGDRKVVGVECLRLDALLDRYAKVRVELEIARRAFVELDPDRPRYLEPAGVADAARRVGVARLSRFADEFIEVLKLAQDDQAALGRLVPMSQADFYRAVLVKPITGTSPRSRMLALARFHSNLRVADRARLARERLAGEQTAKTVSGNRQATAAMPVVLKTLAQTKSVVDAIVTRNGSRVILAWSPGEDCYWPVPSDSPKGLTASLQAAGLTAWPASERSLAIQLSGPMLLQLVEWITVQRQAAGKLSGGTPQGERPLYFMSKQTKSRYLSSGHWGQEPEVIVAGELGLEPASGGSRAVLRVDSIVVGVNPTVATVVHNRKHWGLLGRVIRRDKSFPVTLHRPRTIRKVGGKTGPTIDPFGSVGADKAGGGEDGYLRILVAGDEAAIKSLNESVTSHMQAEVKKTQTILPAVTLPRLEQGLIPLVGNKQALVDARTIGGTGLRALLGAHRLSAASARLYPDGALYAYNITIMHTSLSAKGWGLFNSEIRDRVLMFVVARDGIWLLSSSELCEVAEKVLPRAGFYTKGGRKPLVPTDRDPDVAIFEPSLPRAPTDPKAPAAPVAIVEPSDADGQAACRQHAVLQSAAHQRALKEHQQNITNGAYKSDNDWRGFQQSLSEWRRTTGAVEAQLVRRKTRLGETVKLREDLQKTWNEFARAAVDAVKQRAGRPEKPGEEIKVEGKDVAVLPSIREALEYRLKGGDR